MNGGVETALVIGATSDIGRAIARTLVEEGCTLQLAARYLAKDARYGPERLREGYPRFGAFEAVRAEAAGAPPRFTSELSRRLAL